VDRNRKQLAVLTAAGLAVATVCAGVALAFTGGSAEQPERDTVPIGQLVDVPASDSPVTSSSEPSTETVTPDAEDTTVPNQPVPTAQQQPPAVANDDPAPPVGTTAPPATNAAGEVTSAPPPPTVRCRMDDSDPVTYPNGREICETIAP
jgi:hypothetical protein